MEHYYYCTDGFSSLLLSPESVVELKILRCLGIFVDIILKNVSIWIYVYKYSVFVLDDAVCVCFFVGFFADQGE